MKKSPILDEKSEIKAWISLNKLCLGAAVHADLQNLGKFNVILNRINDKYNKLVRSYIAKLVQKHKNK